MTDNNQKIQADSFLTKNDTLILKGIAVLLLVFHHILAYPDRIPIELNTIVSGSLAQHIGDFGKLSVAVFSFLGGYGKYLKYKERQTDVIDDLKKLYLRYWKIFIIFIPIAFIFFRDQTPYCLDESIYSCYSVFSIKELLLNFAGVIVTYNREWWFIIIYVSFICMFPLFKKIADRYSVLINLVFALILQAILLSLDTLDVLLQNDLYFNVFFMKSFYLIAFYLGVIFARFGLFSKAEHLLKKKTVRYIVAIFSLAAMFFIRVFVPDFGLFFDAIYAIIFVFSLKTLLSGLSRVSAVFALFGKHSMNIWLVHTFFCYYFGIIAVLIFSLKWFVPVFLVVLGLSFLASFIIDAFYAAIGKGTKRIINTVFK